MTGAIEIRNERLFAVDQRTLFNAVADPEQLRHWWGPNGFTNIIEHFELVAGGTWITTMTASDGTDFRNRSTFEIVDAPNRIVFMHHEPIHVFRMEMLFSAEAEGTRLTWSMHFEPNEENVALKKFIAAANEQNFDRLEGFLQDTASRAG